MEYAANRCGQGAFLQDSLQSIPEYKSSADPLPNLKSLSFSEFHLTRHSERRQTQFIKKLAGDLRFSKDVVEDRGLACLPFREWHAKGLYDSTGIISCRHGRGMVKSHPPQHNPCHMKNASLSIPVKGNVRVGFGRGFWKKLEEPHKWKPNHLSTQYLELSSPLESSSTRRYTSTCFAKETSEHDEGDPKTTTKTPVLVIVGHRSEKVIDHCWGSEGMSGEQMSEVEKIKIPETLLPVYYKIPEYLPLPKEEQEPGSRNKTAESLHVRHYTIRQPQRQRDQINPLVEKYVNTTKNSFEQEHYPGPNCQIAIQTPARNETDGRPLPSIAKTTQNGEKWSVNMASEPLSERQALRNTSTQWMEAWMLSVRWQDATLEQLKRDLTSVHSAQKVSALAIIASASVNRPRDVTDHGQTDTVSDVPAEMLTLIRSALKDQASLVRIAAALCLYFLGDVKEDAKKVLFTVLEDGISVDSWLAAQCLALRGDHSYLVIRRILTQLFEDQTEGTTMQACYLLRELSKSTNIIHSMLGDELNNGNWKDRVLVCRTIAQLLGGASQDLRNKLNHLMWGDWNMPVRCAAAEALQQMGYGNLVHEQIRKHLERGNWRDKVDALFLIGGLQRMTDQLHPGFIRCFSDDYVKVRRKACQTAGLLQIKDEMVLDCLCELMQNDPAWKNQVFAIKALGQIGQVTDRVKEMLLRALRSEVSRVRLEACLCIATLHLCDSDVQSVLQDQMILESHERVKRELRRTLAALNMEQDGNQEMTSLIQHQISKLCQKEELIPKVLNLSETLEMERQKMEMITSKKDPLWKYKLHEANISWGQSYPSSLTSGRKKILACDLQALLETDAKRVSRLSVKTLQFHKECASWEQKSKHPHPL